MVRCEYVQAEVVQPLRTQVLRPQFPVGHLLVFPEDDDPSTFHIAAYLDHDVVGVATFMSNPTPYLHDRSSIQLRGMAVRPDLQGVGVGKCILGFALETLPDRFQDADALWCHARESAKRFYDQCGFQIISERFDIPGVGPHFVMMKNLWKR